MLDRIEFLIMEAFVSLRRNTWMTFSAVTTSAMALFLLGGLGIAYLSIMRFAGNLPSRLEMRVMMQLDMPRDQVAAIGEKIKEMPEVANVRFISKEQAWKKMREAYPDATAGLDNVMPDAFGVTVKDIGQIELVRSKIEQIPGQDGVEYMREEYQVIDQAVRFIRLAGAVLGGMMLLTSGVLIYNAIRLAFVARRREIKIMELVGASRSTIWLPLLVEGVVQGSLGGVIAASVLWAAFDMVQAMASSLAFLGEHPAGYPVVMAFSVLVSVGAVYGLICSAIAVRAPRKER
ncbi:MAG TPA: permease-like cell division protein FtsX [Fimbriimonadaceae bacterium]|nr:permease-like cell division protein FtsX [Fimbriimonadaceae bacterium]